MSALKVYHSIIDSNSLQQWLTLHYDWPEIVSCRLLRLGLNDTYEVHCSNKSYIVRLYRAAWRSVAQVHAEIEVLCWLQDRHFPIAAPVPARDGEIIHVFHTAEGQRSLVAFEYISGHALTLDRPHAVAYGRALAQLHQLTDSFHFQQPRFALDAEHLIDQPLQHLHRAFGHHQADMSYIHKRAQAARKVMLSLAKTPSSYGFCHGDHFGNVLQQRDQSLIMIDFDCCGLGYRVYDIVQFYWALKLRMAAWRERFIDNDSALWHAFLQGYQSIRTLESQEWHAMPAMFFIRSLWGLALQPQNEQHWGSENHDSIWQQNVALFYVEDVA